LAVGACAHEQPRYYTFDPNTGQPVSMAPQRQFSQPRFAQQTYGSPAYQQPSPTQSERGLYSSSPAYAQQAYDQPRNARQTYAQQAYVPPSYRQPESGGRGLFTQGGPFAAQPRYAVPQGGPYVAAPNAYAAGSRWQSRGGDPNQ
ncbi:MAG: hypothetical protein HY244_06530, partial [Rhizobiales bacterium]|nr:hypothetical protein [Hyphomicrobiales bacterium]